jgi:hypothetical protein
MIENNKLAIVEAAGAASVLDAALLYRQQGISVIPCAGKRATLYRWKDFQQKQPTVAEIMDWRRAGLLQNLAIVCGAVSGNLVVIDLDGERACHQFMLRFPDLLDTFTVASGSGAGKHLYFYASVLPVTTRLSRGDHNNIEVRANGCYVVAPPSIHPSGNPYRVEREAGVMRVDQLDDVVRWLISQRSGAQPQRPASVIVNISGWAGAALEKECEAVRQCGDGNRNNRLNLAAFYMGQLIGDGMLPRDAVESRLYEAAAQLTATDGEEATLRTITSGLEAGIRNPRSRKARA